MQLPPIDMTYELSPRTGNAFIYGVTQVPDATTAAEPGHDNRFAVTVDLGTTFNQEPVVLLTRKFFADESRNILDTGDHMYSYYWSDPVNFSRFELIVHSTRLMMYPPSFSYVVVGNVGFLRRLMTFLFG